MGYRKVEALEDAVIAAARAMLAGIDRGEVKVDLAGWYGEIRNLRDAIAELDAYEDEQAEKKERARLVRLLIERLKDATPLVPKTPKTPACATLWGCSRAGGWTFDGGTAYCKTHAEKARESAVSQRVRDTYAAAGQQFEWWKLNEVPIETTRGVAATLGVSLDA